MPSKLFIGMPVRNNALTIRETIDSLRHQDFRDWTLFIADNASTDSTLDLCNSFARKDSRIKIHRHDINIGAAANFSFVLKHSDASHFMWSAGDDVWADGALSACFNNLGARNTSLSFGLVESITPNGKVVRTHDELEFLDASSPVIASVKYVLQAENKGKANLIYGIGKTVEFQRVLDLVTFESWGSDMAFVLGLVSQGGVCVCDTIVLRKRLSEKELGNLQAEESERGTRICDKSCPIEELDVYVRMLRAALKLSSNQCLGRAAIWIKEKSIRTSWYIKNSRMRPYIHF